MSISGDIQTNILLLDKHVLELNNQIKDMKNQLKFKKWQIQKAGMNHSTTDEAMKALIASETDLEEEMLSLKNQHDDIAFLIKKISVKLY